MEGGLSEVRRAAWFVSGSGKNACWKGRPNRRITVGGLYNQRCADAPHSRRRCQTSTRLSLPLIDLPAGAEGAKRSELPDRWEAASREPKPDAKHGLQSPTPKRAMLPAKPGHSGR